ncbi:MAG: hypothetical protein SWK90_03970 [Chloroflexota bacterium]|nr:hypothetical protein [Chloroflexota bacterium]
MFKPLRLTVLTPAQTLLDVEMVTLVQAHLADSGRISIYPGHMPLLAESVTASLRYTDGSGEHTLNLEGGILQVDRDCVTVFTSGLAQPGKSCESTPGSEDARFDRLAQTLLTTMQAQSKDTLDTGDEKE